MFYIIKSFLSLSLTFFSIFLTACSKPESTQKCNFGLADNFKNPSSEFRSAPFWVWNCDVDKLRIDFTLAEYKDKGFGGVFLHPRYGLQTEYLSGKWFDLAAYAEKKCEELGLNLWIYDENSYPSGFAGGHVPDKMPESWSDGYALKLYKQSKLSKTEKYFIILEKSGDTFKDITREAKTREGQRGDFYCYRKIRFPKKAWYAGKGYVDLLRPGVTEKFLDLTMTGYKDKLGNKFGKTVKGVFTDEPELMGRNKVRWTPDLFAEFKKRHGYDLATCMPSLSESVGNWKKVRHDYHSTLLELFVERWSIPYKKFCDDNGLLLTGHYWEHGWPMMYSVPDNMAMAAYHHIPAIDMLFLGFDEKSCGAQFGNVRSVKEVSSIANQLGRKRVLSETYGGAGWQISFERMKMFADWQFVLGVNFVNQHVGHMSMAGVRKYDYPPMFCTAAPWWENYRPLADYIARMSVLASSGEEINDILVLEPTTSIWANCGISDFDRAIEIGSAFQSFITGMSKKQIEYDLASEHVIRLFGKADGKSFTIGKRSYKYFVIPPLTENIEAKTFEILKEFAGSGGKIIAYSKPRLLEGETSADLEKFFDALPLESAPIESAVKNSDVEISEIKGGNILHQTRKLTQGTLVLAANIDPAESATAIISANGICAFALDSLSGEIKSLPIPNKNGRISVPISLKPAESAAIIFSGDYGDPIGLTKATNTPAQMPKMGGETQLKGDGNSEIATAASTLKVKLVRDNVLCLEFVDLQMGDTTMKNAYFLDANNKAFQIAGFEQGNPWFRAVQFKREFSRDFSKVPPMKVTYKFTVRDGAKLASMKLLCERAQMYKISLNGIGLKAGKEKMLDSEMNLTDISGAVKNGENILVLELDKFNLDAEIEPVYILGNFSVENGGHEWVIGAAKPLSLGSIKEQGAPFYPWEVSYIKKVDIKEGKKCFVSAPHAKATVSEVWANGTKCGILMSRHDELDISNFVKNGVNEIELRTIGGMENFFGPHFCDTNKEEKTSPRSWMQKVENAKPSDYFLSDYGLMKDFEIRIE